MTNIVNDYRFLKSGLNIPLCVYFASRSVKIAPFVFVSSNVEWQARIATLGYLLLSVIFSSKTSTYSVGCRHSRNNIPAIPSKKCGLFSTILLACSSMAFSFATLLFFFRLRAIYNQNRITVSTFFVLWLVFPAASIWFTYTSGIYLTRLNYTSFRYCTDLGSATQGQFLVTQIGILVYDTLVFITISWRLCKISYVKPPGPRESLKLLLFGEYLPIFTKSLYRDGQVYYL